MLWSPALLLIAVLGICAFTEAHEKPTVREGFCHRRKPGNYGLGCSEYFIECSLRRMEIRKCKGSLYFDEGAAECVFKERVRACFGKVRPRRNALLMESCSGYSYGVHAFGCSREYLVALPGYCSMFVCPYGYVYDAFLHQCAPVYEVVACIEVVPEATTKHVTTTKSTTPKPTTTTPKPTTTTKKPTTTTKKPTTTATTTEKPTTTTKKHTTTTTTKKLTTTTPKPSTTTTTTTKKLTTTTTECPTSTTTKKPTTTTLKSTTTITTTKKPTTTTTTKKPTTTTTTTKKPTTTTKKPTTTTTTTTKKPTTTTKKPITTTTKKTTTTTMKKPEFSCKYKPDGAYGWGCSCDYVVCVYGVPNYLSCPSDLMFDEESGRCVEKQYVKACGGKPTPAPILSTSAPKPAHPCPECSCKHKVDGVYSLGCSGCFCSCKSHVATYVRCPKELAYDDKSGRCLAKAYVKSCGGVPTTPQPYVTPKPKTCDGHTGVISVECRKYIICIGHIMKEFECPVLHYFDVSTHKCVYQPRMGDC